MIDRVGNWRKINRRVHWLRSSCCLILFREFFGTFTFCLPRLVFHFIALKLRTALVNSLKVFTINKANLSMFLLYRFTDRRRSGPIWPRHVRIVKSWVPIVTIRTLEVLLSWSPLLSGLDRLSLLVPVMVSLTILFANYTILFPWTWLWPKFNEPEMFALLEKALWRLYHLNGNHQGVIYLQSKFCRFAIFNVRDFPSALV